MRRIKDVVKFVAFFAFVVVSFFILYGTLSHYDIFAKGADFSNIRNLSGITKIEANIKDVPITVVENDVRGITISSTVKNRGIGIITQPKAWEKNGVLYFNQGYVIGHNAKSTGDITIEIPRSMTLDIDIESGSGDVTIDTSASRNVFIDAAVGEITVKSKGDNLSINSVSGDINIEGVFKNTEIDTVSSDAKMYAGSDTNQICYESVSGDATIYTHGVRGYNLLHEYSGGKVDEYFEVKEHYKAIFDIYVDTVDGSIDVIDFNDFLKREHKWNTF